MSVGGQQVEASVVVDVEEGDAEAEQVAAGRGQADGRGLVGEGTLPQVAKERGRLTIEIRHGQVGPAVAVEVAAGHAHPGLIPALRIGGDPRDLGRLLEPEAPRLSVQVIGRLVVGDEEVDAAVVVEVGGDHAQAPAVVVEEPRARA